MTVLQSATAERVASNYQTIWVGVLGPPGDPDMGGTQTIAHVSEGAPSVVVLNVVSDLFRSDVTIEEADAELEGEPLATIPVLDSGPVIVTSPTSGEVHRLPVVLAPGPYRVWVEVEGRDTARELWEAWDYDTDEGSESRPTAERWRLTYVRVARGRMTSGSA